MSHPVQVETPNSSSSAAFWACLIFVGLLVGAINFTRIMGESHGSHGTHDTEHVEEGHHPAGHGTHDTQPAEEATPHH